MTSGRIEFGSSYTPTGRIDFDATASTEVTGFFDGRLLLFSGAIQALCGIGQQARFFGTFPVPQAIISAAYNSNVWRGIASGLNSSYQSALPVEQDVRCTSSVTELVIGKLDAIWKDAIPLESDMESTYASMLPISTETVAVWKDAIPISADCSSQFSKLIPLSSSIRILWHDAISIGMVLRGAFFWFLLEHSEILGSFRDGIPQRLELSIGWRLGLPAASELSVPWKEGMYPPSGKSKYGVIPPPSEPSCYAPTGRIDFGLVAYLGVSGRIHFTCTPLIPVIPLRPVYIMLHQIDFIRVDDNLDIATNNIRLTVDMDSWSWGIAATIIGRSNADALDPNLMGGGPVEVELFIDGYRWRFFIDKLSRSRSFPGAQYQATGRSLGAELADPWYPSRNFSESNARTAQQLAAAELPVDWALDWSLTDWLVPAGVWSYQNLTPVQAVKRISQAAGGFAVCDRQLRSILVRPIYKIVPWNWDTISPDHTIPADIMTRIETEWIGGADYEAVWVQGMAQGRSVNYKRAGTAGTLLAPSVVDPLITHVDAGRQRGSSILSASRTHANISVEMPISTEIPLLELGDLVWIEDTDGTRKTIVKSVGITAGWQNGLSVRQSVTLEEHV